MQVGFQLSSTGHEPSVVTPEQVGTQVLKYLLQITADFLGHDQVRVVHMFSTCYAGTVAVYGYYTENAALLLYHAPKERPAHILQLTTASTARCSAPSCPYTRA